MSTRVFTAMLLAAGLAACKPITSPHVLRDLVPRQGAIVKPDVCASPGSGMIAALTALESRAQGEIVQTKIDSSLVVNININDRDSKDRDEEGGREGKAEDKDKAIADAARKEAEDAVARQALLQGVNQALLVEQKANAAANEMDNVLRAMALAQKEPDRSTVILVVQEVKVSVELEVQVDKERKETRKVDASVFKQEVVVANRGKQETRTVMAYNPRTLTATDIAAKPETTAAANGTIPAEASATQTIAAVVYDAKPTHSQVMEDPAESMRAALEAVLEDRQKNERRAEDAELSIKISVEIKVETEERNQKNKDDKNDNDKDDKDKDGNRDGKDQDERKQKEAEQQEAEQRKQDRERENKEAEQQRQDQEKKKQEDEQKRKEAEQETAKNEAEERAKAEQQEAEKKEGTDKAEK